MLTIALSKGYLMNESLKVFQKMGIKIPEGDLSRKLEFTDVSGNYRFLVIRPSDVPVYVEYGVADLGVAGKDVLIEGDYPVAELLDLKFGFCRLAVAGKKDAGPVRSGMRVATKFTHSAQSFFTSKGIDVELIKLYGSVELAAIDGLADAIVDLVATGRTLKENGLEVWEDIYETTARLIANNVKIKSRYDEVIGFTKKVKAVL
jgi:ATP phosphoribosyltransferase